MKHTSIKVDSPIELIDVVPLNPLISKCRIKVCYVGDEPNRNGSIITKDVAIEMARSLPGAPIVGYYNEAKQDFEGHNQIIDVSNGEWKIKDTTQAYGFVDLSAKPWFQKFMDDGVEHEYLMVDGYLWTEIFPEAKRILEKGNGQSMELDEKTLDGFWSKNDKGEPTFFIINEALISKLCILGEDTEPCFEGASIGKVQFSLDEGFQKKLFSMMKEVNEINKNKGGKDSVEDEVKIPEMEEENVEPNAPEEEAKVAEPEAKDAPEAKEEATDEPEAEDASEEKAEPEVEEEAPAAPEDKPVEYNLDEIEEYVELKNKFEALQTKFNEMESQFNSLVEFKKAADRKEKQAMINSFYMLSDEDKKDVIEHIDEYSVDDIEAKLSVICVRNKVNFNLEEDNKPASPSVFNLDDINDDEDDGVPAWIKAVRATKEKMN